MPLTDRKPIVTGVRKTILEDDFHGKRKTKWALGIHEVMR
jgi:hypothetical protein